MKSLAEFVALARAKPDTLNVAAAAGNSELIMSSFIKTQNLPVAKVPYRDILQAPNDLAQGRIQALLTSYAAMLGLIQSGKIKILAMTSTQARRHRARRSDRHRGGLSVPRHGQPDRHLRPARHAGRAARQDRGGRPGRHCGRPDHRAAARRHRARSSTSAVRRVRRRASRRCATSLPTSPRCSGSRPRNKRSNRLNGVLE